MNDPDTSEQTAPSRLEVATDYLYIFNCFLAACTAVLVLVMLIGTVTGHIHPEASDMWILIFFSLLIK